MEYIITNRDLFDFEIGYLTKSPCLGCENKSQLPKCHDTCPVLDQIQTTLARGISSQASGIERQTLLNPSALLNETITY